MISKSVIDGFWGPIILGDASQLKKNAKLLADTELISIEVGPILDLNKQNTL
ncbi:Hypothetical protein FKW44_022828, partial [Caligus rogercresseyi]